MDLQAELLKLFLAISLGALMGLEREGSQSREKQRESRKHSREASQKFSFIKSAIPASSLGGVRTYILVSLLGAVTGMAFISGVTPLVWVISIGFLLFIHISFLLNYFDKNTLGLTMEISLILNFFLSMLLFASDIPMKFIVLIAVLDAVILSMKAQLHLMVSKFSREEILATIKFILFAVVILPFIPDAFYGLGDIPMVGDALRNIVSAEFLESSKIFNPNNIWAIIALVLGLNFVGYFTGRILGRERGVHMLGLIGGIVSSTAVTESMARLSKATKSVAEKQNFLVGAILANMTSFLRVIFISTLLNFSLGAKLALPFFAMSLALLFAAAVINLYQNASGKTVKVEKSSSKELGLNFSSPFALGPAIRFGVLYLTVIVISKATISYLGESGFLLSSMIASMVGLDAITVTAATLIPTDISVDLGVAVLVISACVNLLVKVLFASISGDAYFRRKIGKVFLITMLVGILALLFVIRI